MRSLPLWNGSTLDENASKIPKLAAVVKWSNSYDESPFLARDGGRGPSEATQTALYRSLEPTNGAGTAEWADPVSSSTEAEVVSATQSNTKQTRSQPA